MPKTMTDGPVEIVLLSYRERWLKACEYDGIDPKAMFIVFSEENPYAC